MGRAVVSNKQGTKYRVFCNTIGLFLTEELTADQMVYALVHHGKELCVGKIHPAYAAQLVSEAYDVQQKTDEYTWLEYKKLAATDRQQRRARTGSGNHDYLWQWHKQDGWKQVFSR